MAVKKVLTSGLENRYTSFYHDEYLIDDGEDIAFVPRNCAPGSLAYTVDLSKIYQLSNALEWVEVSSSGGDEDKVTSVNGMTGDVTLTAEDIGATNICIVMYPDPEWEEEEYPDELVCSSNKTISEINSILNESIGNLSNVRIFVCLNLPDVDKYDILPGGKTWGYPEEIRSGYYSFDMKVFGFDFHIETADDGRMIATYSGD